MPTESAIDDVSTGLNGLTLVVFGVQAVLVGPFDGRSFWVIPLDPVHGIAGVLRTFSA